MADESPQSGCTINFFCPLANQPLNRLPLLLGWWVKHRWVKSLANFTSIWLMTDTYFEPCQQWNECIVSSHNPFYGVHISFMPKQSMNLNQEVVNYQNDNIYVMKHVLLYCQCISDVFYSHQNDTVLQECFNMTVSYLGIWMQTLDTIYSKCYCFHSVDWINNFATSHLSPLYVWSEYPSFPFSSLLSPCPPLVFPSSFILPPFSQRNVI